MILPLVVSFAWVQTTTSHRDWCEWALGSDDDICDWMDEVDVDSSCTFRVRSGLWTKDDGVEEIGPALELTTSRGKFLVEPHMIPESLPPRLLCTPEEKRGDLAILKVANSASYLFRLWPYFVSFLVWAQSADMYPAFWIGELPTSLSKVTHRCKGSPENGFDHNPLGRHRSFYDGTKDGTSNHHIKIIASYTLLNQPSVHGIVYEDLDVRRLDGDAVSRDYRRAHLDNDVDILFGSVKHVSFWRVKSQSFYMRDALLSRRLLATWMTWRCGFKDQFSLWHSILQLSHSAGCMVYEGEIINTTYKHAGDDKRFLHLNVSCGERTSVCPAFRFCSMNHTTFGNYTYHKSIRDESRRYLEYRNGEEGTVTVRFANNDKNATHLQFSNSLGIDRIDPAAWIY